MIYINEPLERAIKVTGHTRPIRIAYIVSAVDTSENHLILDAIFFESYARWGGCETLIIPANNTGFLDPEYERWLAFFDPDFICSYIDMDKEVIKKVANFCHPSVFIRHQPNVMAIDGHFKYSVNWRNYTGVDDFVSSITTILALKGDKFNRKKSGSKVIFTQHKINEEERFFSDNFGTTLRVQAPTFPLEGLFDTYLLESEGNDVHSATKKTNSAIEALNSIASNEVITFYELASSCNGGHSRITTSNFGYSFQLFIGENCLERINFWNARHLTKDGPGSIIVSKLLLEDERFLKSLGSFLNNNNFLSHSGSRPHVELRSQTLNRDELVKLQRRLQAYTHNTVILPENLNILMLPTVGSTGSYVAFSSSDSHSYKISEKGNEDIAAQQPRHFQLMPTRFKYLCKGRWAVDLEIERINNLSRMLNTRDIWQLPRRNAASRCFAPKNLNRVTRTHLLSIVPDSKSLPTLSDDARVGLYYFLYIPSDDSFFRSLFLDNSRGFCEEDLRLPFQNNLYQKLSISDKGQYLRGVIAMFKSLDEAYESLTTKFWREVIRGRLKETKDISDSQISTDTMRSSEIYSPLERNTEHKENIKKEMPLVSKDVNPYMKANFTDSLEFLVHKKIFFRVHDWRCEYCGRVNAISIDNLKNKNHCEVCNKDYELPLDFECTYKLNDFVVNSLGINNGMTVLWTLGFLHNRSYMEAFYYIPEIRLFDKHDDKVWMAEIDIICIIGGKLYLGEVKKSAAAFVNQEEIDKFIEVVRRVAPDVALLAFEQYCDNPEDVESVKQKLLAAKHKIENCGVDISVKILIAVEDDPKFDIYPVSLYPSVGRRSEKFWI